MNENINLSLTREDVFFIISTLNQRKFYLQDQLKIENELIGNLEKQQYQGVENALEVTKELYKGNLKESDDCINLISKLTEFL